MVLDSDHPRWIGQWSPSHYRITIAAHVHNDCDARAPCCRRVELV